MAAVPGHPSGNRTSFMNTLNTRYHEVGLNLFMFIVVAHWAEHLVQAFQIWALDTPRPKARGVLGQWFPWLISSEWLHYGYAIVMLVFLFLLRPGFRGRAKRWWTVALAIQFWHHIEHFLLLLQAQLHENFFGGTVPTSVAQTLFPRVELHLFYNTIVTIPMVIAVILHKWPSKIERDDAECTCAVKEPVGAGSVR